MTDETTKSEKSPVPNGNAHKKEEVKKIWLEERIGKRGGKHASAL